MGNCQQLTKSRVLKGEDQYEASQVSICDAFGKEGSWHGWDG